MLGTIVAIVVLAVALGVAWDVYRKSQGVSGEVGKVLDAEAIDLMNDAVRKVRDVMDRARDIEDYELAISKLKVELTDLATQKSAAATQNARYKLDIEHKVGLERQRHEQELELSKRESALEVKEANLTKDIERFADQMEFERNVTKGEMESLRTLTGQLLERLPNVKAIIRNG